MKNPFKFDVAVSGIYFCGREDTIKEVLTHIENETNLIMFSKRRIGKSSLIKEIFENRLDNDVLRSHIDIYAISNERELYEYLKEGIQRSFVGKENSLDKLNRLTQSIAQYFSNATVKLNISTSPSIEITSTQQDYFEAIKELFDGYFAYLQHANKSAVIAIDEFQKIVSLPNAKKVEELLRTIANKRKNLSFIFTGSKRNLLLSMFNRSDRPFYKLGIEYRLLPIGADNFYEWANERLMRQEVFLERRGFDYLYEQADGETRFMQMVFYTLFNQCSNMKIIQMQDIRELVDNIILSKQELGVVLDTYTNTQQNALKLIAYTNGKNIYNTEALKRYALTKASLQSALRGFIEKGVMFENKEGYEFEDVEFKMWLSRV
jgi:AAA+ ATPase superfamily predicted ATPase